MGCSDEEPLSKIAFQIAFGPLVVMDVDGSNQKELTTEQSNHASWSPDGSKLAFMRKDGLYTINLDGSNEKRLVEGICAFPAWSPDGKKIAYSRFRPDDPIADLYVADIDGTKEKIIAEGLFPSWSPDGNKIAFNDFGPALSQWYPKTDSLSTATTIYTVNLDGGSRIKITNGLKPSWSPDGSRIAFVRMDGDSPET